MLTFTLIALALGGAATGFLIPTELPADDPLPALARLGIAAAVVAVAQLFRLRFRVSSGMVSVTWGEAAFIIGLSLVPPGWLPAAFLVGAGLAWALMTIFVDQRSALDVVHTTAALTTGVAVATVAALGTIVALGTPVTDVLGVPVAVGLTPQLIAALAVGSLTYLLATAGIAGLTLSLQHAVPLGPALLRALAGKLLMFVGNVLVGLAVVAVVEQDPRWLLLLPPVLWLLQQTYSHRLRADDERRTWRALAEATGALNQLDEHGVATAGVTGALALFGAERVEVDVLRADGRWRRYRGEPGRPVVHRDLIGTDRAGAGDGTDQELVRPLMVGTVQVGELRVRLPRTVAPHQREQDALSAFGDALASALHDAATHRELRLVTARSSYEAVHDALTNLINRAALLSKGDVALHQLGHDHPVALLLLDIDHFKEVNDTLGHAAGDELLQATADRLDVLARPGELLGRLGGDEFALLIPSPAVLSESTTVAERSPTPNVLRRAREIVELLATPIEVAGVRMSVEVSVGVVVAGAGTADMTELLRRADIAMYQAKEGGGSVASYDSARDAASTDKLALLAELREALDVDDQLELALQPAVDLSTGEPTGVEALIRWRHPRRGRLNPVDFVRTIEGSELLGAFTRYVVDKALGVAADWARHGLDVPISINLSARSLLDPRLPAEVAESLRRHQVPARRLVLEITETVVMSELEVIDEVLSALRAMGVQLAVDDFGTGFSSLTFLTRISVDELKVDRSFVMRMADSPEAAAIVRTTVDLGRELGLRVVAEGVETADQRAALAELGCTAAQGYHFFRPMPSDKIVAVLRSLLDSAQARIFPLRADGAS
ncbi:bifunctional diguanylate cyclase/phosphodiesterase [Plantactinospora sp. S1510]|uniref:Bifunctional diguanylate cyclase/phosphodiesterase n=1 Tax=Plantactinospora alkalitolerans TaxID=2789879 RepID=A0ABS0GRQ9_9ACTN|nr:bifunctional diguanylate cyclase/phosphodiesterase [Plantactinospora alkalitolerans]MBF9128883.1 bifunctional diguanylate cyclase/phosphodiesterase [Plantactinospora alkalitolerans]